MTFVLVNPAIFMAFMGGWEVVLILAVILILVGAKKLPGIGRGLGEGISRFRDETKGLTKGLDDAARDAGKTVGGVYGKPAAQALTPDNHVAEFYDPAVFHKPPAPDRRRLWPWVRLWRWMCRMVRGSANHHAD